MYIKMKHRVSMLVLVVAMMIVAFSLCVSATDKSFGMSLGVEFTDSEGNPSELSYVKKGDIVIATATIDKNPGFRGILFSISYDATKLELQGVGEASDMGLVPVAPHKNFVEEVEGMELSAAYLKAGDIVFDNGISSKAVEYTGDVVSFKFKVTSDAEEGVEIKLNVDSKNIYINHSTQIEADDVVVDNENGTIKVHNTHDKLGEPTGYVAPTCYLPGKEADKTCSLCGHITEVGAPIEPLNHPEYARETIEGYDATCGTPGLTDGVKCNLCGDTLDEQEVIPSGGHDEFIQVLIPHQDSTCTVAGHTAQTVCRKCGAEQDSLPLPLAPHDEYSVDLKEATCTESGHEAGRKCNVCKQFISGGATIPKLNHSSTAVIPKIDATCTTAGKTEGLKCLLCPEILVEQTEIPALGHQVEIIPAVEATYDAPGKTAGKKCGRAGCGIVLEEGTEIPQLERTAMWIWIVVGVAVVAIVVVVVVYFVVIKKKNYKDDMFDDDDEDDE